MRAKVRKNRLNANPSAGWSPSGSGHVPAGGGCRPDRGRWGNALLVNQVRNSVISRCFVVTRITACCYFPNIGNGKILHVFFSTIGLGILTIILFLIFTLSNKSVISSNTVNIIQKNDKIYIEEKIWLESYNHVNVYQIENIIFIKSIGNI